MGKNGAKWLVWWWTVEFTCNSVQWVEMKRWCDSSSSSLCTSSCRQRLENRKERPHSEWLAGQSLLDDGMVSYFYYCNLTQARLTHSDVRTSAHIECRRARGAAYKCTSACFPFLIFSQLNTLIHTTVHSYVYLHPHICAERHASTKTQALHTHTHSHTHTLVHSLSLSLSLSLSQVLFSLSPFVL